MTDEIGKEVRHDEDMLIALLPPLGPRRDRAAILAYLKIANGRTLEIQRSLLEFLDSTGRVLETRDAAFEQSTGTILHGPFSQRFSDEAKRPPGSDRIRWLLNETVVEASLSVEVDFRVMYLPLRVAVEGDPHIVVTIVNTTTGVINVADAIRSAVCYADDELYPSNRGGHWDGAVGLNPDSSTTRQFSLDDFPGVPRAGRHKMSVEILAQKSRPEIVDWRPADEV